MKIKSPMSNIISEIHVTMFEAVKETGLGIKKQGEHYHFVTQEELEDYAIRCFRVAVEKLDVKKVNKYINKFN